MGLDMYLSAEVYVSGHSFRSDDEKAQLRKIVDATGIEPYKHSPSATVRTTIGYWRKANHIHSWFVRHCQDGKDECQDAYVSEDNLRQLLATCKRILDEVELSGNVIDKPELCQELLPCVDGFFFGGTDYDKWYLEAIKDTVQFVERALSLDAEIFYRSSW